MTFFFEIGETYLEAQSHTLCTRVFMPTCCCTIFIEIKCSFETDMLNVTGGSSMSGHLSSILAQTYHRVRKCLSVAHISQDVQLQCKIPGAESAYGPLLFFSNLRNKQIWGKRGGSEATVVSVRAQKVLALIFWLKHSRSVRFGFPCLKIALLSFSFGEFSHKW